MDTTHSRTAISKTAITLLVAIALLAGCSSDTDTDSSTLSAPTTKDKKVSPDSAPVLAIDAEKNTADITAMAKTTTMLPDFASYTDVKTKKREFFNFLLPRIRTANDAELARRDYLLALDPTVLNETDSARLATMAKRYRIKTPDISEPELINQLLIRVDSVPASLILAQGANESAWGTSRFAKQGLNFFGIWCFSKGCGITPSARNDGASHQVQKFKSLQDGVNKYVITLNSHPAYKKLRQVRATQRANDEALLGAELAVGLEKYSERGTEYVEEIQSMISYNKLETFNRKPATLGEG
ncbi:MAG: Bax protein [Candidatus Azotimanducaceae bacterium]|jgi:Bax protein